MEALVLFACTPVSIPLGSKIRCRPGSDSSAGRPEQVRAQASARPTQYPPLSAANPSPNQTRTAARDSQVPSRPDSLELALQENREARSRTVLWLLIIGAVATIALIVSIVSFIVRSRRSFPRLVGASHLLRHQHHSFDRENVTATVTRRDIACTAIQRRCWVFATILVNRRDALGHYSGLKLALRREDAEVNLLLTFPDTRRRLRSARS